MKQSKLKLLKFGTKHVCNITRRSRHDSVKGPENLGDFNHSSLAKRKGSYRFLTAGKTQTLIGSCSLMSERSSAMTCSSMIYKNMKFDETWTNIRKKYDKIKCDKM